MKTWTPCGSVRNSPNKKDAAGWYVVRFAWDTHHANSSVAHFNGFCFPDIDRADMIAFGPYASKLVFFYNFSCIVVWISYNRTIEQRNRQGNQDEQHTSNTRPSCIHDPSSCEARI